MYKWREADLNVIWWSKGKTKKKIKIWLILSETKSGSTFEHKKWGKERSVEMSGNYDLSSTLFLE